MGKSTKTQRLRERMRADVKHAKQTTLGILPEAQKEEPAKKELPQPEKKIEITEINASAREDELALKVGFKLVPSRTAFFRVSSDLVFDGQKIDSLHLRILQGPLATDDSEYSSVLDMTGIAEGQHSLRVEIYELWGSGEKLTCTSKETTVNYVPVRREDRLVKIPIMKSIAGADLAVVSASEKSIYREIEETMKKELESDRDEW